MVSHPSRLEPFVPAINERCVCCSLLGDGSVATADACSDPRYAMYSRWSKDIQASEGVSSGHHRRALATSATRTLLTLHIHAHRDSTSSPKDTSQWASRSRRMAPSSTASGPLRPLRHISSVTSVSNLNLARLQTENMLMLHGNTQTTGTGSRIR